MMRPIYLTIFCFSLLLLIVLAVLLPIHLTTAQDTEPQPLTPANCARVGCTRVGGNPQRSMIEPVVFSWTASENSTEYHLQIAKNPLFDHPPFDPIFFEVRVPTTTYDSAPLASGPYGQTIYIWRVRATKPVESQWSSTWAFIYTGCIVLDYPYGPQLLSPVNGYIGIPVQPVSFSWSSCRWSPCIPCKEVTRYRFVLSRNAAMTRVVKDAEVSSTYYEYDGALDYSTNYFWRVMALEPEPGDWSATFSFQTEPAPPPPPPPPSTTKMSCKQVNIGSSSASLDVSPLLLGAVLLGLVFASRQRPSK